MKTIEADILNTKKHFLILDGLRGIAALSIVIFHFMEFVYPDSSKNFIGHGFLAVDFFFCLSGFVIGYAYDGRLSKMGVWEFFKSRLIRLHPLVIIGSVIGVLGFLFDPFSNEAGLYSAGRILFLFICSVLLIPFPSMPDRGLQVFNFNSPSWSLFFEYVANIFYGLVLYKISKRYLYVLILLAATALCLVSYRAGNLLGGWSGNNFSDGFARVSYSFLAGLLVYRSGWIIKNKLGFVGLSVMLLLAFMMPHFTWNWLAELLVVLFYFPLLIALGAGAMLNNRFRNACVFLGKLSYPLYMTHYAAINWFGNYYLSHKVGTAQLFFIVITATILLIGFAYIIMKVYDIPLRKYLTEKRTSAMNSKRNLTNHGVSINK